MAIYSKINNSVLMMLFSGLSFVSCSSTQNTSYDSPIKPYTQNPKYWQYKGEPVLLLGGTDDDNLFQMAGLEQHLDELKEAGGNYIRNTMSFRDSANVCPFRRLEDGKYDLNSWSDEYWKRFELMLKLTHERDIIVQIEVWDRFDYSREFWEKNPFNPSNNINYSLSDSLFDDHYPKHPSADLQPFFHTIPGMALYNPRLDRIRDLQEKLIDKMLSYSLDYGNVLYCMNNETSTPVEWGNYWIDYIRSKAESEGKDVYLTDMYDRFFEVNSCDRCLELIAKPEYYTFMDISQINSRNFGQAHWDTLQVIMNKRNQYALRPVNNTKIYGGGNLGFGSGSNADGVERFGRNVIGGCASARHHRPPAGNGLNEKARGIIKATRKVEDLVRFWEVEPHMHLLTDREPNEAYLTCMEGSKYIIYFPKGGNVKLDLSKYQKKFTARWINIETGEWGQSFPIEGGSFREISAPDMSGWYVVIT
ncbi:MAG: putative collagen-binding domain-containing protein [Cyclobacteriaceae bacterium]